MSGPDLANGLLGVLCRFRKEQVTLVCDIEAMFHQFKVPPRHRDYLRFLWWEDGDLSTEPREYRMTVHLFGAASSPSCANFGLRQIAKDYKNKHGLEAARFIQDDFYVDDGLKSVPTELAAIKLSEDSKDLCAEGGLRLHKFMSNSRKVLESIPIEDRATGVKEIQLDHDLPIERTLGVQWSIESDAFQFHLTLKDQPLTRRGVLSTVCSIYDPLGFIAPVTLLGKQILQQMCRDGKDWDDPLSDHLEAQYRKWRSGLVSLKEFQVQRCFKPAEFGTIASAELHMFSDASTTGYGQCTYLRLVDSNGRVHCSLVMAKSRVAPLKSVTIPRLELTAAVVSAKMCTMLKHELQYEEMKQVFWTDSKIVLGYLKNTSKRFHVFVANRVQQILERSEADQWRYVATAQNPADIASRGLMPDDLAASPWLLGPAFLWEQCIPEPSPLHYVIREDDPEVKTVVSHLSQTQPTKSTILQRLERISSWSKMKKITAVCLKAKDKLKSLVENNQIKAYTASITVEDLQTAEKTIIRLVQEETFMCELQSLEGSKQVPRDSVLLKLDSFLDNGILRIGGRLKNSNLPPGIKHPIVMPKNHPISLALLRHFHSRVAHQGRSQTISELRSNGYWIIGASKSTAKLINECVTCRKMRSEPQQQLMADLPADRLQSAPAFTYCGADYFGPWLVKEGRKTVKRYGVLFTCLASRGVHIETAVALDSSSFINALRRFISLRGRVRLLRSDRGTNFVGAQRELKEALKEMDESIVKEYLRENHCDFEFNPPAASHCGGVWERQIRTVRSILSGIFHGREHILNDDMIRTVMYEAAAIINSRPLCMESLNDPTSLRPITPNMILTTKSGIVMPPPGKFQREDLYCRRQWRRVQHLVNEFWYRWKREYVHQLQQRQKWQHPRRNLKEGDVVLIKDDHAARCDWRLARVVEAVKSTDGLVRRAKVRVGDPLLDKKGKRLGNVAFLERPVQKLVLLVEMP